MFSNYGAPVTVTVPAPAVVATLAQYLAATSKPTSSPVETPLVNGSAATSAG